MSETSNTSRPSRRARALFVLVTLALVLTAGEVSVRAARALLTRDLVVPAGEGKRVVYCIGDSFTWGLGLEREESYPQRLQVAMDARFGEGQVVVQNWGTPGRSSSNARIKVAEALARDDAALIIVWTGWNLNDNDVLWWRHTHGEATPWSERVEGFLEHSVLYRVAKRAATLSSETQRLDGVELVPMTSRMELYDFRVYQQVLLANLTTIAAMTRQADVPLLLVTYPAMRPPPNELTDLELYHVFYGSTPLTDEDYLIDDRVPGELAVNSVVRHVAERHRLPVVDIDALVDSAVARGQPITELIQEADRHHPTSQGARLVADALFERVAPALAASPRQPGGASRGAAGDAGAPARSLPKEAVP